MTLAGGCGLQNCFSWAVYDFLDDLKDKANRKNAFYRRLRRKYKLFFKDLEIIGNERSEENGDYDSNCYILSKKMLLWMVNEDRYGMIEDLERYINVYYKDIKG
jgi:hypothetical protein